MELTQATLQLMVTKSAWFKHRQLTRYSDDTEVLEYRNSLGNQLIIMISELTKGTTKLTLEDLYFFNENPKVHSTIYNTLQDGNDISIPKALSSTLLGNELKQIESVYKILEVEQTTITHFKLMDYVIRTSDHLFLTEPNHERRQYLLQCLDTQFFKHQILLHPLISELITERYASTDWYKRFTIAINL